MKQVFIVNSEFGSSIMTKSQLVKTIVDSLKGVAIKVKRKDIESYADGVLNDLNGQAISNEDFESIINNATVNLVKYTEMSPYDLFKIFK